MNIRLGARVVALRAWWDGAVLQLLVLAVAGLLGGAALGARKNGAPTALVAVFLLLAVVAFVLAVAMLVTGL